MLFSIFSKLFGEVVRGHGVRCHQFAYDTQLLMGSHQSNFSMNTSFLWKRKKHSAHATGFCTSWRDPWEQSTPFVHVVLFHSYAEALLLVAFQIFSFLSWGDHGGPEPVSGVNEKLDVGKQIEIQPGQDRGLPGQEACWLGNSVSISPGWVALALKEEVLSLGELLDLALSLDVQVTLFFTNLFILTNLLENCIPMYLPARFLQQNEQCNPCIRIANFYYIKNWDFCSLSVLPQWISLQYYMLCFRLCH